MESQHSRGLLCCGTLFWFPKVRANDVYLESQRICLHPPFPHRLHKDQPEKYCFPGPISIFIDLYRPQGRCLLSKSVTAKGVFVPAAAVWQSIVRPEMDAETPLRRCCRLCINAYPRVLRSWLSPRRPLPISPLYLLFINGALQIPLSLSRNCRCQNNPESGKGEGPKRKPKPSL